MLESHAFQIVAFADAPFAPKESEPVDADPHCHNPLSRPLILVGNAMRTMTKQEPLYRY